MSEDDPTGGGRRPAIDRGEGPDPDRIDDSVMRARDRVIEAMERSAEVYGLNRSYGRLYGVLFFADEPLSLDELVEQSGYAKSTVSTAMNDLERLHLVHRRSIPGEGKKAFFEAERDFWHVFTELLRQEVSREISIMVRALEDAEEILAASDHEQADDDLEKVRQLQTMYDRSETLVNLMTSASMDRVISVLQRLRRTE